MTVYYKTQFSFDLIKLYLAGFVSVFVHLMVFYQVASPLNNSSFLKLLGKKGGLETATEISFFPQLGAPSKRSISKTSSPLDIPSSLKPSLQHQEAPKGTPSAALPSKGIGQGGTSVQYTSVLHAYLDSAKIFPRSLKDLGLSGVVKVRFQVTPEGKLEDIRLAESEAPKLLQQEAVRFLQKLEKVPVPPSHFTSQQLQFELPLRYELKS